MLAVHSAGRLRCCWFGGFLMTIHSGDQDEAPEAAPLATAAARRTVWCQCWGTPEPDGPWVHPDDEHADTCGIDALKAETRAAQEGHSCTCEYPYPVEVWQGHHPNCDLVRGVQ